MTLEIIGAGFGRTGTESLRLALTQLGFGPCHHMYELIENPEKVGPWVDMICEGAPLQPDQLFDGYRAQVDWPGAHIWRELAQHFPDAKVILSVRDPKAWYASASKTIFDFNDKAAVPPGMEHLNGVMRIAETIFADRFNDEATAVATFDAHVADVTAALPPERLLVYQVGSGWEPLCAFLGVPVPSGPYPVSNTAAEFRERNGFEE